LEDSAFKGTTNCPLVGLYGWASIRNEVYSPIHSRDQHFVDRESAARSLHNNILAINTKKERKPGQDIIVVK
jgi:hypothetical protein